MGSGLHGLSSDGGELPPRLELGERLRIGDVGADWNLSSPSSWGVRSEYDGLRRGGADVPAVPN